MFTIRRKTNDEYVAELKEKNPNVIALEEYAGAKTPILHKCLICGYEWMIAPTNILNQKGCPNCHGNIRKTQEEYEDEVAILRPDIEVIGEYINAYTPILHRCKICGYTWKTSPANILNGKGCPNCWNKRRGEQRKKTHEEYVSELALKNPTVKAIGDYKGANTKILHHCLIHDIDWETTPSRALQGMGCPKCHIERDSISRSKSHSDYVTELHNIFPQIEIREPYITAKTPIKHFCTMHNIEWMAIPTNVLRGHGCYMCGIDKIKEKNTKTHEEYVQEVKEKNPDIEVIDLYQGADVPIHHKCLQDGNIWKATPASILSGTGCPQCNESSGERHVRQWLEGNGINYIFQHKFDDCRDTNLLPFDFYLPEYNSCIEYDGGGHFKPIRRSNSMSEEDAEKNLITTLIHDGMKNNYCKWNDIRLLRISFFKNIDKELNNFLFN